MFARKYKHNLCDLTLKRDQQTYLISGQQVVLLSESHKTNDFGEGGGGFGAEVAFLAGEFLEGLAEGGLDRVLDRDFWVRHVGVGVFEEEGAENGSLRCGACLAGCGLLEVQLCENFGLGAVVLSAEREEVVVFLELDALQSSVLIFGF